LEPLELPHVGMPRDEVEDDRLVIGAKRTKGGFVYEISNLSVDNRRPA
jgi:hypothetical protein